MSENGHMRTLFCPKTDTSGGHIEGRRGGHSTEEQQYFKEISWQGRKIFIALHIQ